MDSNHPAKAQIDETVQLWTRFWGESLHSIHLYGSHARGDWVRSSDINLLIVLRDHDYAKWDDAAGIVRRKVKKGFGIPLLMSETYIQTSLDVYPIEFLDLKLFHETLHGDDILADLDISHQDLRLQAEREIKGKWVALRQAALERGGNTPGMRDLLAMSVPTWAAVFQALITIDGKDVPQAKADVLASGAKLAGCDPAVFERLLQVRRDGKGLNRSGAWGLLIDTLKQVDRLAAYADGLVIERDV